MAKSIAEIREKHKQLLKWRDEEKKLPSIRSRGRIECTEKVSKENLKE